MAPALHDAILEVARAHGDAGAAMGELVDRVIARGFAAEAIEAAIWELLAARLLTPSGLVCRLLRARPGDRPRRLRRTYELHLAAWSPERDAGPGGPPDAAGEGPA